MADAPHGRPDATLVLDHASRGAEIPRYENAAPSTRRPSARRRERFVLASCVVYCRVLACDFDGTGASDGHLAPEVAAALADARARGIVTLLVTGRVLEDLRAAGVDVACFDAIVAENGAVVFLPHLGRTIQIGAPPPERFFGELRARGVPFSVGAVVVATWEPHTGEVLAAIRRCGLDAQIVFNRAAVMVLPSGVTKAVGVQRALLELGRSERNLIAFGDAENDLSLFALAEVGVAARGSVPSILEVADDRLTRPGAPGVATYVKRLFEHGGTAATPDRQRVRLGCGADGVPATLPSSGVDLIVSGDPRTGKSWIAGLVVEQLLDAGYRLCILDPEGDHVVLGRLPGVLVFGDDLQLPAADVVPQLMRGERLSLVLNLSRLTHHAKARYVDAALGALAAARAASGIPQWIVVDEAHYFFHERSPLCRHVDRHTGNFVFVTYRPSLLASCVHAAPVAHLVQPTDVEDERYFMTTLLQQGLPAGIGAHDALASVRPGSVGLLLETPDKATWQIFQPGPRACPHTRHARKYVDTLLPNDRAFFFQHAGDAQPAIAHSITEFAAAVAAVPVVSLAQHLEAGDFSRWVADVIGDTVLAAGLRKLETVVRDGGRPSRAEILAQIGARYHLGRDGEVATAFSPSVGAAHTAGAPS